MATAHPHGAGEVPCPDPSAHEKHNKLADQASTAALYVTKQHPKEEVLGKDGKLSASSAAASLKYAKAQDLPSFPTVGVASTSDSAGAAAMLAKDYKMKDLWRSEPSEAGSRAALLAARDGGKLDLWQPTASKDGNSAATLAMRNKTLSPQLDRGYTPEGRSNALLAATKSQRQSRQPAVPSPTPAPALYPDQANSARNALSAATASSRNSVRSPPLNPSQGSGLDSPAMQAARVHNIGKNVNPEMWGERPPVEIEVEEKKHQEALRASAISMAKQMYDYQNRTALRSDPAGNAGAGAAVARNPTTTAPTDLKSEALKYIHLQDAAQKLAQERLAKVDKNFENAKYREYYGYNTQPARSRLSMRGRQRGRGSEDQEADSDDEEQARRVRGQMSQFSTALADVDANKQAADRKALLAAAERNVHKSMSSMDDKVFQETGKVSQSKMDEWSAKARAKAQVDSDLRQANHGKTHVGGGKFMDQSEIEAIALARLKPTLDEISDTAEKKRARDEELRLEREEQERQKRSQKEKEKEEKDEAKKIKNEEKAAVRKDKDERKALEKEEKNRRSFDEKAAKAVEKESNRKSVEENAIENRSGEPKEQRKSFLSRLASKRKSRDVKKDDAATASAAPVVIATADPTADIAAEPPSTTAPVVVEPAELKTSSEDVERSADVAPEPLDRVESYHTGHHNDAIPSPPLAKKPDLERHISKIESSDGSSLSDWDEEDDADERSKHAGLPVVAAGSSAAAVAAASPDHDESHARNVAERVVSAPITDHGAGAAPLATSTPSADLSSKEEEPVVPSTTTTSTAAPAVIAKPAPVVDEPRQSTASSRPSEEEKPKGLKGLLSKFGIKSKAENKTSGEPKATNSAGTKAVAPAAAIGTAAAITTGTSTSSDAAHEPTVTADHIRTDGPIGASTHFAAVRDVSPSSFRRHRSSDDKADTSSLSSASSSGLDEDDLHEGRTGRMARALRGGQILDKGKQSELPVLKKETTPDVSSPTEESDTFEEARDHFDEGLAPQPAFAGQAKSQSPARETRFKEEV